MSYQWLKYGFYCAIVSVALGNANCGSGNSDVDFSFSPERTFFLPGNIEFDDSSSCYDATTISSPRFQIDSFTTTFTGEGTFQPILLKITGSGGGNVSSFSCAISGRSDKGLGLFLFDDVDTLSNGDTKEMTICIIHCGGVSFTGSGNFTVNATVELIGIRKNGSDQVPISKKKSMAITNVL